jgi:lipoate-protein ligase A
MPDNTSSVGLKLCDLTLPSPAENLACDQALLDLCEEGAGAEVLRLWVPARYFVVLGYANLLATEVNLPFCAENTIPVLRRCTGGGTVLQGPGVLNYSLILRIPETGPLTTISGANQYVLSRHQAALANLLKAPVEVKGQSDLAIGGMKFSGNAQRRKKNCLLYHGSFLLHLDFDLMEKALPMPSRQPDYRLNRRHEDFLVNLHAPASLIKQALVKAWGAHGAVNEIPFDHITALTTERYGQEEWTRRF